MTGILLGLAMNSPAFADLSDSGNLTIGGQGIVQGTMTVQGQDSSGYSLKVSSSIQAQCITLQNGQLCGGGGSGNAVLSATQTWSGANAFSSTATIGYANTVYTTTITAQSVLKGGWSIVAVSSFTNAAAVTFSSFASSTTYRFGINVRPETNGVDIRYSIQGLSNTHAYANVCLGSTGGSYNTSGESQTSIKINGSDPVYSSPNTYSLMASIMIQPDLGQVRLRSFGQVSYSPQVLPQVMACSHAGETITAHSKPYGVTFSPSSGNITGVIWVEQLTLAQSF